MQKKSVKVSKNRGFECQLLPSSSVPGSSGWIKHWWRTRRGKKERKKSEFFFQNIPQEYIICLVTLVLCQQYQNVQFLFMRQKHSHSFSYNHTRCLVQRSRNLSSHILTVNSQARAFMSQNIRGKKVSVEMILGSVP